MTDFIISFGIWASVLVGSAVLLGLLGLARIRAAWLVFGVLIFAGYFAALMLGGDYIPVKDYIPDVEWNWAGKIATVLFSLVLVILLAIFSRSARPSAVGFTLRQAPGSLTPALIVSALLLAASIALGRAGLPDDIGGAVTGLLLGDLGWMTAQRIEVSGGQQI